VRHRVTRVCACNYNAYETGEEFGMKKLLLFAALATVPAFAQTVNVQPKPYAQAFADTAPSHQVQVAASGRALGNLIAPQVAGIVIDTLCGKYAKALVTYSNGTEKSFDVISPDENAQQHIKMLAATSPHTTILDLGCPQ
jgi:hypothetical protein